MKVGNRFLIRDFAGALAAVQNVKGDTVDGLPKALWIAEIQIKLGNPAAADAAYREAEESLRKTVAAESRRSRAADGLTERYHRIKLAEVCAALGKREEAIRLAEEVLKDSPEILDVTASRGFAEVAANVFGRAGDLDRATRMFRNLLEVPSNVTRFQLRNSPNYDEFRKDPGFAALVMEPGP